MFDKIKKAIWALKTNMKMKSYQKAQESKWAKFNKDGEMTSDPTTWMVKEFNSKFTTTKSMWKMIEAKKARLKK